MTGSQASRGPDPFVGRVIGRLTILSREMRGHRWGYTCRCACGALTLAMRAAYIVRRGELAACFAWSHGVPRAAVLAVHAPESDEPEIERHAPSSDAIWRQRAERVAEALETSMTTAALIARAGRFGWSRELMREVLAAGEGVELVKSDGVWQRRGARHEGLQ